MSFLPLHTRQIFEQDYTFDIQSFATATQILNTSSQRQHKIIRGLTIWCNRDHFKL